MTSKTNTYNIRRSLARAMAPAFAALAFSCAVNAQDFNAGTIAIDIPANTDMVMSFPFRLGAEYVVDVSSSTANTVSSSTVQLPSGALSNSYYAFIEDGKTSTENLSGRYYDITSNTVSSLTLDSSDSLSGLTGATGGSALISVHKYWTIGEAFQGGIGFHEELEPGLPQIQVIIPTQTSVGGGLVASQILQFYDGHWRKVGSPLSAEFDDFILAPHHAFVIRNNSGAAKRAFFFGEVIFGPLAIPILDDNEEFTDNFVSHGRPLGITLDDMIGGAGQPGLEDILGSNDRLLVYSMGSGKNKTPVRYKYTGSQWQEEGSSANAGGVLINAAQGIAISKAPGITGLSYWLHEWN